MSLDKARIANGSFIVVGAEISSQVGRLCNMLGGLTCVFGVEVILGASGAGGLTVVTGDSTGGLGGVGLWQPNVNVEMIMAFFMVHFFEKLNGYTIIALPPAGGSNCNP